MDSQAYARRFPFSLLVWNAEIWHLNSHHQTPIEAVLAATELTNDYPAEGLRIWDNHACAPLEGWAGVNS